MKNLAVTLLVLLFVAGSVVVGNASVIYQDDFEVNDYALRYTSRSTEWWWPGDWTYYDLGDGNMGLAPAAYWYKGLIDTKDYLNGHFTNTSYSASVDLKCFPAAATGPAVGFVLLNNGFVGSPLDLYGYKVELVNVGAVVVMITRINSDGTATGLFDNWAAPSGGDLSQWSNLTATVDVRATETYLGLEWNGVDTLGNACSYFVDYHDTSAQRWTSGTGIGINGFCGNGCPSSSAVAIDNLVVSTVPEPSALVALACGLISLCGLARRRA